VFDPANKRVTEATIRIGRATAPWFLRPGFRRVSIALMDEPLRRALGMEAQPRWLVAAVDLGLRLRARILRFAPPRATPYERFHPTYPNGYEVSRIGPASMLDKLNQGSPTPTTREHPVACEAVHLRAGARRLPPECPDLP
jgi:hypothetical protein